MLKSVAFVSSADTARLSPKHESLLVNPASAQLHESFHFHLKMMLQEHALNCVLGG